MTLYDYCKEQLEKTPKIVDFIYGGKRFYKEEIEKMATESGTFESRIEDEKYIDYDGTDENGPIYLKKSWLVCRIKKVGE